MRDLPTTAARWWLPAVFCLAGIACLGLDYPVSRWFNYNNPDLPKPEGVAAAETPQSFGASLLHSVHKVFDFSEVYADGLGVAFILLIVFVLDASRRRYLPRLLAASLGAGLVTDIVKILVVRERPKEFFRIDPTCGSVWDTFHFQGISLPNFKNVWQSFPSGHATTAVGLTIVLCWMYPRGRWLFPLLALVASMQRVVTCYHFPSDVCWGATVGSCVGLCCLHGPLARLFSRFEARSTADGTRSHEQYPAVESIRVKKVA